MPSGTIYGTTSNQYIDSKIEYSYSQDMSANTSTVTAALYYKRNNTDYTTSGYGNYTITIGDRTYSANKNLTITENAWVKAVEFTNTISHNSDGTKSITISATGVIYSTSLSSTSCSGTVTLATIPKASTITSASPAELGGRCKIVWTPASASFYYKIKFSLGTWSFTPPLIMPNTTSAFTYTAYNIYMEAASNFPNETSGTMTATLYTYSDEGITQVGSESSATFTVTLPNIKATQPSVTMELSPVTPNEKFSSLYLKGISKVKADIDYTTKYGATAVASNITVNGISYDDPYESDILSQSGTVSVKATVKDSRGYYGTYYKDIEVIPYEKPYIQAKSNETSIIAARCDSSANFTDSGTYLKIKAKIVYSKVISNEVQNNYGNIKFRYRKEGGTYSAWQTILNCKTDNSDEVITPPLLNGALDVQYNYQVQIAAYDDLNESVPITLAVPSEVVYMDRPAGGKSMGLGGYSTGDGKLDIYWKTIARGGLSMIDSKGDEIPLDSTLPLPRGQVASGYNPDNLENGAYVVTNSKPLKSGDTVIMYNGILIQVNGTVDGSVKFQLALTSDETRNPFYRAYWYGNWGNWRSFKL